MRPSPGGGGRKWGRRHDDPLAAGMADLLVCQGVTRCVMEATSATGSRCSTCSRSPSSLAGQRARCQAPTWPPEDRPAECGLAGKLAERQMLRPLSCRRPAAAAAGPVPLPRNLTRCGPGKSSGRRSCRETPRSSYPPVISDIFGFPGRTCWPHWSPGSAIRGAGRNGPGFHAEEDHPPGRGVDRAFPCHHGFLLTDDARPASMR